VLKTLLDYLREYRRLGHEGFVAEHASPVVVFSPFLTLGGTGFRTLGGGAMRAGMPSVGVIRKRAGTNPFTQMITLGRAGNNDLELKAASVSKFHGYFTLDGSGAVFFTDSGSTFGTKVNDTPLLPKIPQQLQPGERITFGVLSAQILDPAGFADFLRSQIEGDPDDETD